MDNDWITIGKEIWPYAAAWVGTALLEFVSAYAWGSVQIAFMNWIYKFLKNLVIGLYIDGEFILICAILFYWS